MDTKKLIRGLHHVTATVDDAREDYTFYTQTLGLRLVKTTVNFDNNQVYHFYYGNQLGNPGTIMTTFPYKGQRVRQGIEGTGQVAATAFSVPIGAIPFWETRLEQAGVATKRNNRFGQHLLSFADPAGLKLEIIENDEDDREPWVNTEISEAVAIRGFFGVTLSIAALAPTINFLENEFGFKKIGAEGKYLRFVANDGPQAGNYVDIRDDADEDRGHNGIGTVHHVAWRVESDEALLAIRNRLVEDLGFRVTEVKDRNYFHSIYFRMPGHVLFEIATIPPGFTVDETPEELGQALKLPAWEEVNRAQIEQVLPQFR